MEVYSWLFICSFFLLLFLFYMRSGLRKKYVQKSWIERIETIARDNHTLWSTHLPYSQKERLSKEFSNLQKELSNQNLVLNISDQGDWSSKVDLLKYASVKRLFKKLLPSITSYSRTLGLDPKWLTIRAWSNTEKNKAVSHCHHSQDALFSGCYFLKTFQKSEEACSQLHFYKKQPNQNLLAQFHPNDGDLFLYPSDMVQEFSSIEDQKGSISIGFDIYFGTRKKSWLISKISEMKKEPQEDPFYDQSAQHNVSQKKTSSKSNSFFHISKIK